MGKKEIINWLTNNSKFAGLLAGGFIFIFYFGIITLANSFEHALSQFSTDWPWIVALAAGFGIQARLHLFFKFQMHKKMINSSGMMASGGVSGTAMIACCAHHISDALPFLGLAGVAGFLFEFREVFLLFGVLSNLVGIIYLLTKFNEYGIESGLPAAFQKMFGKKESVNMSIIGSAAVFFAYFLRFIVLR